MAIRLLQAGYSDLRLIERSDDIGGTWHTNRCLDVAVDVPGIVYQFSFAKNPYWSRIFPNGAEVKAYLDDLAETYALRELTSLRTEVVARHWDASRHRWRLTLDDGTEVTARFVVNATGAFVEPRKPDISGLETFAGTTMWSQSWDDSVDLRGKRIAVIARMRGAAAPGTCWSRTPRGTSSGCSTRPPAAGRPRCA